MLFVFVFIALAGFDSALSCSRDRAHQCEETLLRSIQRHIVNKAEMTPHCMNVREDFNCLLEETRCLTTESERNQKGNSLRNALNYIRDGCDTLGGSWRDSTCYISERMKACENSHPLGGSQYSTYNPETCRKFKLFEDCVKETVRSRCRSQDEKLLGQYLVESAQDLAWNCGEPTKSSSSDWDRTRGDYDRDRYDQSDRDRLSSRDRDRDRDFDRTRDYDRNRDQNRDRDRLGDRDRYNDRYNDRNGSGYDRNGGGYDRNGGGYDRNGGGGYDRGYGNSDISCCRNERCSSSRMAQCRDSLSRTIESRSSGYQDSQKCRKARDDFNCLLWQTSNCQSRNDRDRDNDIFRRAKDFISRNCDTYGRWSENSCFKSAEMVRCENTLPSTRGGASYESCRAYNNFKDCMLDELQRRCTREDELYQGAYLVDKAQELSWMCGSDQYSSNGRNQYFTDNRRDPYDTNGYVDSPQHLDDDDAMCLSRIQAYNEKCKATMDDKKKDIYITNEYEARQKINCCAIREYRSCLYDATRRVCQTDRSNVVENLMGRYTYELSSDNCRRIYDSDCNSGSIYGISTLLLILCSLVLFF